MKLETGNSKLDEGAEFETGKENRSEGVGVTVDPGICGFVCTIRGWKEDGQVRFDIQSECEQIKKLALVLGPVKMKDLFAPLTRSPVFLSAEKARCHLACPVPSFLVKTAEVVLGLALPKDVLLRFLP